MIGVIFDNIKYKEDDMMYANHPPKPIPKNLIDAWKDQLFYFQPADVEFSVQDKNFTLVAQYFLKDPNILRKSYRNNGLNQRLFEKKAAILTLTMMLTL